MKHFLHSLLILASLGCTQTLLAGEPNFHYLDEYCDPYYPHTNFPKLTTPQWIGEEGVDAVITLGIDDMRDPQRYEAYLRPLLERLKKIDGRAPVSIMTCSVDPQDPQLQAWLKEGLSIEIHTIAHPCPLLQGGDFARAKKTYDDCVDLMSRIPHNRPVAFRFPCCDSLNTPSPRAFAEILNRRSSQGNFLQASSSVLCLFTPADRELPRQLTVNEDGSERFRRYIPFPSFVNVVENYPYPYLIGGRCWEFPITIPDDWQGQNIQRPNNPRTVDDLTAAIDATVLKKGIANIVFHPHGWIRADQMAEVVDRVQKQYGKRVKFLTFKECMERINQHLLLGQPVRAADGGDNGVRLLDLNQDGYLDVLIGNGNKQVMRLWDPIMNRWRDQPNKFLVDETETSITPGVSWRIGMSRQGPIAFANDDHTQALCHFGIPRIGKQSGDDEAPRVRHEVRLRSQAFPAELKTVKTASQGLDLGVRFRDLDGDGISELIVANPQRREIFRETGSHWKTSPLGDKPGFPAAIVNDQGRDNGVRFCDIDQDGFEDVIVSNDHRSALHLYEQKTKAFQKPVEGAEKIPNIVAGGMNQGVWFAQGHMWLQNENTNRLPDGVDRRTFTQLLGNSEPKPQAPQQSLRSLRVRPGFQIQLVAAEPLVMDPVALDWGADGKLWVVEMADYPLGLDDRGKPGGRVRYLEDTDHDGQYDKSTVFLDGIPFPTGVMAWRNGVLVSAAPSVFYAEDTNGDGTADVREDLYRGFGEGNQQHRVNGFEFGLDNWIYLANGDSNGVIESVKTGQKIDIGGRDLRIRPATGALDAQTGQTQFGRHRDDYGNWFGCSNPVPVRHYVLADHYLRRNRFVTTPSLRRDVARADNTELFPISRVLSHWSGYRPPTIGQSHRFTSACSTAVYRDSLFGDAFANSTFTCAPVHNAIHRRQLQPEGILFESQRPADEQGLEFLASSDSWFRPTTVTTGPDGAVWVTDMYRLVIEHPEWIDDQREKQLFLRAGHDRGRIYRIVQEGSAPHPVERFDRLSSAQLVEKLKSPNGRQRDLAQRLLIERNATDVVPLLRNLARNAPSPLARLHSLCTLDGLDASEDSLLEALHDEHPAVRRHAIRIAEPSLQNNDALATRILAALRDLANDKDAQVRLQLAYSLGYAQDESSADILAQLANQHPDDALFRAAILSSLHERNLPAFYAAITRYPQLAAVLRTPLFAMASRMQNASLVSRMLAASLGNLETRNVTTTQLTSLAETLRQIRQSNIKLADPQRKSLANLAEHIVKFADDSAAATEQRVAAIQVITALPSLSAEHQAKLVALVDSRQPTPVQLAVINSLDRLLPKRAVEPLLQEFDELSPAVRVAILDNMLEHPTRTEQLLDRIAKQKFHPRNLSANHRQQLLTHTDPGLRAKATNLLQPAASAGEMAALIKQYASKLSDGDRLQGRQLFTKHCASCHRVAGVGKVVGPDLATLKNRSPQAMLNAILDPNQAVEDKYRSYSLLTTDGRTLAGLIKEENSNSMTLQLANDKQHVILRSEIELLRSSGKSLMPEGLHRELPPQALSDLIAYLAELGPPPKQFPGNHPAIVEQSEDGTINLPATTARIYGPNVVFEEQYSNLGFWSHADDRVAWTVQVSQPGVYEVWLDYACETSTAGNAFVFNIGPQSLRGKVQGSGSWDDYATLKIGTVKVSAANTLEVAFAAEAAPRGFLLDLRGIILKPVTK